MAKVYEGATVYSGARVAPSPPDVTIQNQGSVFLFVLHTPAARDWVGENVSIEDYQWLGSHSFAVDHRFAADLATGMAQSLVVA